jgi:hypothetical protein
VTSPIRDSSGSDERLGACHVYLVAAKEIPADMPRGDCFACGKPLRTGHEKRVSKLMPDDGRAFVIDETVMRV